MALFTLPPSTPAQAASRQILQGANNLFSSLILGPTQLFKSIWANPNPALTPDVVWAQINIDAVAEGATAVQIHQAFLALIGFMNTIVPGSLPLTEPTGWTLVENSDGTITVTKNA